VSTGRAIVERGKYESHKIQAEDKHSDAQRQIKEGIEKPALDLCVWDFEIVKDR
jgi:hypothetical protein